jgi:gamma-glutamyltranspeptidase/glutathione hydrolase
MLFSHIESKFKQSEDGKFAVASRGMIATAFPDATHAGVEMLKKSGNAIDAACAAALALSVCEPQSSGLGGQTMMLIHTGKKPIAIDGSSRAPSLAHVNAVARDDREYGYRACTVPSTLATLWYVHKHYGTLPWTTVVKPAILLAENGYIITRLQHELQKRELDHFHRVPSRSGARYFLKNDKPYQAGDRFCQPDLARLLKTIAASGVEEFYRGDIARQIDKDMREHDGLLRRDDLALIPWPIVRRPVKKQFRHLMVYSMPPPCAGRTLLFTLMMLNAVRPEDLHHDPIRRSLLLIEVFRKALLERSDRPFDPNFYAQVDVKYMLNKKFAARSINKITRASKIPMPLRETDDEFYGETTHLSVMDETGTAVSLTQSIETVYGSKAAARGLGFLYNNYMMDFEYGVPSHPFYLRPNAVPWATVAPTLLFNDNDIWLAVGSPGSERIFSSIAQFLMHMIDEGYSLDEAMRAPRLHCSLGGRVSLEAARFPSELIDTLENRGYRIDKREPFSFYLGALHAVMKKHDGSGFQGIAEIRRDGTAAGL